MITREEFQRRFEVAQNARNARLNKKPKRLASQGKDCTGCPLLQVGRGWAGRVVGGPHAFRGMLHSGRQGRRASAGLGGGRTLQLACPGPSGPGDSRGQHHPHPPPTHPPSLPPSHLATAPPQALKDREEAVRNGKLATIVFIRDRNARGQEVSGYIDYGARLRGANWEAIFERKARLLPRPGDLSFYNWDTNTATSNASPNFLVGLSGNAGGWFGGGGGGGGACSAGPSRLAGRRAWLCWGWERGRSGEPASSCRATHAAACSAGQPQLP